MPAVSIEKVYFGKFRTNRNQISQHNMQIESFLVEGMSKKIQKGHCVRVPHAISV